MECGLCGIKPEEKWENYGPFNEEDFKLFHGKLYCYSCRFQIADVLIEEMFNLEKYEDVINIVKETKNLEEFQDYSDDSILFILISFLKTNNRGTVAKEFWLEYDEQILNILLTTPSEAVKELNDFVDENFSRQDFLDNFDDIYQDNLIRFVEDTPQYKIIKLFVSSLINKQESEDAISEADLEIFKDGKLIDSFEKRLREVLNEHLEKIYGDEFFEEGKGIPDDMKAQLLRRINYTKSKEPWRDNINPFDECSINNLKTIILHNWEAAFKNIFVSKTTLKNHFENINYWRNCLKHPKGDISEPTKMNGRGSIEWFKKMIGF